MTYYMMSARNKESCGGFLVFMSLDMNTVVFLVRVHGFLFEFPDASTTGESTAA